MEAVHRPQCSSGGIDSEADFERSGASWSAASSSPQLHSFAKWASDDTAVRSPDSRLSRSYSRCDCLTFTDLRDRSKRHLRDLVALRHSSGACGNSMRLEALRLQFFSSGFGFILVPPGLGPLCGRSFLLHFQHTVQRVEKCVLFYFFVKSHSSPCCFNNLRRILLCNDPLTLYFLRFQEQQVSGKHANVTYDGRLIADPEPFKGDGCRPALNSA